MISAKFFRKNFFLCNTMPKRSRSYIARVNNLINGKKRCISQATSDNQPEVESVDLNNNEMALDLSLCLSKYTQTIHSTHNSETQTLQMHFDKDTQTTKSNNDKETQTNQRTGVRNEYFTESIKLETIVHLCDLLRDLSNSWCSVSERIFSTIIYMLLRMSDVSYSKCKHLLKGLNCAHINTVHRWAMTLVEEEDATIILQDQRGQYNKEKLYDVFPEIEHMAKA